MKIPNVVAIDENFHNHENESWYIDQGKRKAEHYRHGENEDDCGI